ncbi:proteinaceous RNase P 2 [Striga asiatica]|uniref:Proteinaceous RNase P 2 n=1 Tax=Striga asiatica TaxID=4170 RepID=A0A5A7R7X9_STRAF|nr:proteinaceous RNase P 2 [Striga asiatica]
MLPSRTPPRDPFFLHPQAKVQQYPHESQPRIKRCRQNIVVPLPPTLSVSVENRPHNYPAVVVDRRGRWHHSRGPEQNGYVDQLYPSLAREQLVETPHHNWAQCPDKETPVEGSVIPEHPENPLGPHKPPYN